MTTVELNPKYETLSPFIATLPNRFESEGTLIYGQRNHIKCFVAPDGTLLNVKRYHIPHGLNRLIYSWGIRKPKGWRAYTYPTKLLSCGITTPDPVAYIEERHTLKLLGFSYFVSIQCPYSHTLYETELLTPLSLPLAQFTAQMHAAGILHRDYSPGNILWECDAKGQYHFSVVDTNRMYFGPVGLRQGVENFARLWGSKQFIVALISEYARLRHFPTQKALDIGLKKRRKFWMRYRKKHEVPFPLEF